MRTSWACQGLALGATTAAVVDPRSCVALLKLLIGFHNRMPHSYLGSRHEALLIAAQRGHFLRQVDSNGTPCYATAAARAAGAVELVVPGG